MDTPIFPWPTCSDVMSCTVPYVRSVRQLRVKSIVLIDRRGSSIELDLLKLKHESIYLLLRLNSDSVTKNMAFGRDAAGHRSIFEDDPFFRYIIIY